MSATTLRQLRDLDPEEFKQTYSCDRFTSSVLRSRFEYVIDHVCSQLLGTAFSPIIRDFNDFSATLSGGPQLGYALPAVAKTLAVFYGSMRDAVANSIEEFGAENLRPGDLLISNDPYRNGTHVNDMCFLRPIFFDDELVSVLTLRAHMMDIGGIVPGGFSGMKHNVYETGLVVPPTLLYREDRPIRSTFALIFDNSRYGEFLLPDIQSIFQSLRLGERLLHETIGRYGLQAYFGAMRYACDASAEHAGNALASIPDGVYGGSDLIDCDGIDASPSYEVRVTFTKRGRRAEVDFSGTSSQARTAVNCAWPDIKALVAIALKFLVDPETPFTSAALRDVDIVLPPRTVTNAEPPDGAIMLYWEPIASGFLAMMRALEEALGDQAMAGDTRAFTHSAVGVNADGTPWASKINPSGGWGANHAGDADSGQLAYYMNYLDPPVEALEAAAPVLLLRKEYATDSAGAGYNRGGAGIVKDTYWFTESEHQVCAPKVKSPSGQGVRGGGDGGLASFHIWEDEPLTGDLLRLPLHGPVYRRSTPVTGMIDPETLEPAADGEYRHWGARPSWKACAGSVLRFRSCAGGGWSDPLDREAERVVRDVRDGYFTLGAAQARYGVVITGDPENDPEGLALDPGATSSLRQAMRAQTPVELPRPSRSEVAPTVSVEREPVAGVCAECGSESIAQYQVLAADGWAVVRKCQHCLASVSRVPWRRLGYIHLIEDDFFDGAT
ncbi:MAG: hydantoinase B/oxoprolinase family protein [Acidimicrobiales bacterium]